MKKILSISAVLMMLPAIAVADVYLYTSDTTSNGDFTTGDGEDGTKRANADAICENDTTHAPSYRNNVALISFDGDSIKDLTGYPHEPVILPQNADAMLVDDLKYWLDPGPDGIPAINPHVDLVWTFSTIVGQSNVNSNCNDGTTSVRHPYPVYGSTGSPPALYPDSQISGQRSNCSARLPIYCLGWGAPPPPTAVPTSAIPW